MKTKTIYHLDQECNIVKIEVITKVKKPKKRPVTETERLKKAKEFNDLLVSCLSNNLDRAMQKVQEEFGAPIHKP